MTDAPFVAMGAAAPVALWSQYSSFFWQRHPGCIFIVSIDCAKVKMSTHLLIACGGTI